MARGKYTRRNRRKLRRTTRHKRLQRGGAALLSGLNVRMPQRSNTGLTVMFGAQAATANGPTMQQDATSGTPEVSWTAPGRGTLYTLLVWDPDAPAKSYLHWMAINCDGPNPYSGEEILSWTPPSPPPGTGEHRYIFGLFSHSSPLQANAPVRANFNVATFVAANQLTPVQAVGIRVSATESA